MAPTLGSAVFLDTNILVYASFPGTPFYEAARTRLNQLEDNGDCSGQAARYSANTSLRLHPGAVVPPPTVAALSQAVRLFEAEFEVAGEDAAVTALLLDVLKSRPVQGKQIHDANIVATMRRNKILWLLTHNTADFTRYLPDIRVLPLISPDE